MHCLGQIAAQLDLGMNTRLDASKKLDHVSVADERRGVGLLGVDGADLLERGRNVVGNFTGRAKFNPAALPFEHLRATQLVQYESDEACIGSCIEQGSFPRAPAYCGERNGTMAFTLQPCPPDHQRQQISRGTSAAPGLNERHPEL